MFPETQAQPAAQVFPFLRWAWALRDAEIDPKLLALGSLMFLYANERGEMRPTVDQLRLKTTNDKDVPVSAKTIQRRRKGLVDAGWLELVTKGDGRGSKHASVYRLRFPDGVNGVSDPALNGVTPLRETGTADVPLRETQVNTLQASEGGQFGGTVEGQRADKQIEALAVQTGQSISGQGREDLRAALIENRQGVHRLWDTKAKRGDNPVALLIHLVRAGEHRTATPRCNVCKQPHPSVRDRGPDLRAGGANAPGEFVTCDDCAEPRNVGYLG